MRKPKPTFEKAYELKNPHQSSQHLPRKVWPPCKRMISITRLASIQAKLQRKPSDAPPSFTFRRMSYRKRDPIRHRSSFQLAMRSAKKSGSSTAHARRQREACWPSFMCKPASIRKRSTQCRKALAIDPKDQKPRCTNSHPSRCEKTGQKEELPQLLKASRAASRTGD